MGKRRVPSRWRRNYSREERERERYALIIRLLRRSRPGEMYSAETPAPVNEPRRFFNRHGKIRKNESTPAVALEGGGGGILNARFHHRQ